MIYEKRLWSLPELRKQLAVLDGDAGVRLVCAYEGKKGLAFVTRFHEKYTLLVYRAEGRPSPVPRTLLASKQFEGVAKLLDFLETIIGPKVEAYAY